MKHFTGAVVLVGMLGCANEPQGLRSQTLDQGQLSDQQGGELPVEVASVAHYLNDNSPVQLLAEHSELLKKSLSAGLLDALQRSLKEYVSLWYPATASQITAENFRHSLKWFIHSAKTLEDSQATCVVSAQMLEESKTKDQPFYGVCRGSADALPAGCEASHLRSNTGPWVYGCSLGRVPAFPKTDDATEQGLNLGEFERVTKHFSQCNQNAPRKRGPITRVFDSIGWFECLGEAALSQLCCVLGGLEQRYQAGKQCEAMVAQSSGGESIAGRFSLGICRDSVPTRVTKTPRESLPSPPEGPFTKTAVDSRSGQGEETTMRPVLRNDSSGKPAKGSRDPQYAGCWLEGPTPPTNNCPVGSSCGPTRRPPTPPPTPPTVPNDEPNDCSNNDCWI